MQTQLKRKKEGGDSLIILDLTEDGNNIAANISGSNFYSDLSRIKKIPKAKYEEKSKNWILPKSKKMVKMLIEKFDAVLQRDEFTLAGADPPATPTSVEVADENTDLKELAKKYKLDELKLPLRDFQTLGVTTGNWFMEEYGGFLNGDCMGLGKTVQALASIHGFKTTGEVKKVIVSCPKNVKYQWRHEIETFTDLTSVVVDGYNKAKRLECYKKDVDIYIINHDLLILKDDFKALKEIKADMTIIDEIHYFKTHNSKRTKALKKLGKKTKYRLGLTGTPMQNHPSDTHSIYEFLIPELLGKKKAFEKKYVVYDYSSGYQKEMGYRNLYKLKSKISKYMIRRLTSHVSDEMPKVFKKTHYVDMNQNQKRLHKEVEQKIDELRLEQDVLLKKKKQKEAEEIEGKLMGMMNIQAEIANDLRLLKHSDSVWIKKMVEGLELGKANKTKKLIDLVDKVLNFNTDFKIVIFSRFARMVKLLKNDLSKLDSVDKIGLVYGELNEKQRDDSVQMFRNDEKCRVIIQSDAGAEGLNLQNASHLINFDFPWNPATLDQRNGRINRIGSPWDEVFISNLLSKDSVDVNIEGAVTKKRGVFDRLIENTSDQNIALQEFLKRIV